MHLGLSGEEYQRLCEQVTDIFHLAAISYLGVPKETAWRVNVDGTRNVLELARDCAAPAALQPLLHLLRLRRPGGRHRRGRAGPRPDASATPTRRRSSRRRSWSSAPAASLPVTIYRPSSVVGDSRTGEIDRFEGPYYLGILLVTSPLVVPLPLPGNGVAPLNVVPVDFVVAGGVAHLAGRARRGPHLPPGGPQPHERPPRVRAHRGEGQQEAAALQPAPPAPRT